MYVSLSDKLLFSSGSSKVTSQANEVLGKLAEHEKCGYDGMGQLVLNPSEPKCFCHQSIVAVSSIGVFFMEIRRNVCAKVGKYECQ